MVNGSLMGFNDDLYVWWLSPTPLKNDGVRQLGR